MARKSSIYKLISPEERETILPCPFCGEYCIEKQNDLSYVEDSYGWKAIRCDGCGIQPQFCVHSYEEATRLWNSRCRLSDSNEFRDGMEFYKRYLIDRMKSDD